MRKNQFITVLSLFLLFASVIDAQTISSQKGLTTAVFATSSGTIKIYLPDDIRQGDVISGRVVAEPEGKNEKQLTRSLAELVKYTIGLNGEKFTVGNVAKTIQFTVPADRPMQNSLNLLNANGTSPVQQLTIPAKPVSEQKPAPAQCLIPGHVLAGSPMTIRGSFDGNAANTQCSIGNQPATILAESPRSCIVAFPENANGMQATQVQEKGQQPCTKNISAVQMNVSAGKLNLTKGENTYIDVSITGLQNLSAPAILNLINITTDVVLMQPSNIIAIPLAPDSISSGTFNRRFPVQSIRSGSFAVNVNLDFQDIMLTPVPDEPQKPVPDVPQKDEKVPPATSEKKPDEHQYLVVGDDKYRLPVDSNDDKKTKSCSRSTGDEILPKMDGGLKLGTFGTGENLIELPAKQSIKRDEFVPLLAEGADFDTYIIQCTKAGECPEGSTVKLVPLSGRVRFEWKISGGPGHGQFVKLGCLYTKSGEGQTTEGEQVIFMPPVVQLPVFPDKQRAITTKIKLSIIDDKEGLKDKQVDRYFEIITKRNTTTPDEYQIEIVYKDMHSLPKPVSKNADNKCQAVAGGWIKAGGFIKPEIILPDVKDNDKMVLGQWIVLETKNQQESDLLPDISCNTGCSVIVPFTKGFEDNVQWSWTADGGNGKFIAGRSGRYVIYQAPTVLPAGKTEMEVTIKVAVSNEGGIQAKDDDVEKGEMKITVYQPGIKMYYPEKEWLPEYNNFVTVASELQYKKDGKWEPALAHMCRILFFELLDVSQERGITMNDPIYNQADNCFDFQFMTSEVEGNYEVFAPVDFKKKALSKCTLEYQFMMTRTVKPVQSFKADVYSFDFGSYGFLRSFANTNSAVTGIDIKAPFYESIPWLKTEVSHPLKSDNAPRLKANEYTDNRVNIPVDIDENHIPDVGWTSINGKHIPDSPNNNIDEDDLPIGNKTKGDGLTTYEEFRGFKVISGDDAINIRTNPDKKDLFIYKPNDLDISLFKSLTGLEVHLVKEENFLSESYGKDARVINFNINNGAPGHIINQKGLRLIDAGNYDGLLGIACPTKACPLPGTTAPPNWIYEIRIYTTTIAKTCSLKGIDPKEKLAQVVAHELCHGINICHHGEGNPNIVGDFNKISGLRSGEINCIMRYDNSGKGILGKKNDKDIPESIGTILCIGPDGTGYNIPGNRPGFDNAAPGRGNCLHQIHVTGVGDKPEQCKH